MCPDYTAVRVQIASESAWCFCPIGVGSAAAGTGNLSFGYFRDERRRTVGGNSRGNGKDFSLFFGGLGRKALRGFPTFYFFVRVLRGRRTRGVRATPLVNHPRQKRNRRKRHGSPFGFSLLPPTGGNEVLGIDRERAKSVRSCSEGRGLLFITSEARALGIWLAKNKRTPTSCKCSLLMMNCCDLIPKSPLRVTAGVFRVSAVPENRVNDFLRL